MADIIIPAEFVIVDHENLTVTNAVKTPTAAEWKDTDTGGTGIAASAVLVQCKAQPLRLTVNGVDPEPTVGIPLAAGDSILLNGTDAVAKLKMIREGGTDAEAILTYLT